jgi:hypothetical protein
LLHVQALRTQNGPPLPMACDLCRTPQLQGLLAVLDIPDLILLGVFRDIGDVGMERDSK